MTITIEAWAETDAAATGAVWAAATATETPWADERRTPIEWLVLRSNKTTPIRLKEYS